MKLLKWLFEGRKPALNKSTIIHSITCGERDENGFCDTYVNGEKTNVRLLIWTEVEIERLHKIADEIHKKNDNK